MSGETNSIKIRKKSGEVVDFDVNKLRNALERSGATEKEIRDVILKVRTEIYNGISTHKIYQIAYSILRKSSWRAAGRYRLKKAMLEMGPTGYPFEKFVGKILELQGYQVVVGQIVEGKCVSHEIDVIARKPGKQIMVECKYHSDEAGKSDVKVSLYIHSRFLDVVEAWRQIPDNKGFSFEGMLVTNSRFTDDALQYGLCAGLKMVSWDYPQGNSIKDWIDRTGAYPITSLESLKKNELEALMEKGIILCSDIIEHPKMLEDVVFPEKRLQVVMKEVNSLAG
jgi:Holliday junction resolvase-like predicted endonuclease